MYNSERFLGDDKKVKDKHRFHRIINESTEDNILFLFTL